MNVMKTSLTIFPCVLGRALHHIRVYPGLSFATKGLGHLAALYLLLLLDARYKLSYHKTICYLLFSACREYHAENHFSFPSDPHWVRHTYLSKGLWLIPYTCGSSRLSTKFREIKLMRHITKINTDRFYKAIYFSIDSVHEWSTKDYGTKVILWGTKN